ncbi:YHS domain-containing protein [Sneathiella litorea]|uniref:YHS domain-containing protein n=1 Tax=Sneathiella litorea TaxID=2606216 RepID=A0A6L8W3H2_9PROT|nr:YHS domain-containing protein [Sneathiella litorea]MZR29635.1 YHS domain-containing protein [Sneathiella litorea]
MAMLKMEDWYDLARETSWTPSYVRVDEMFPKPMSNDFDIPISEWEKFDEPYKISYREYVRMQRDKDVSAYSVKAALARSKFFENASPHWKALLALHFSTVGWSEFHSASCFARQSRFGRSPGMRNMATFGTLDEIRHGQIQIFFGYEFLKHDAVFDWCHKSSKTENWIPISLRHALDDICHTRDATTAAIMLTVGFEQSFTNLQFVALSADAAKCGDHTFATMLTSVQTDEARHAQIGEPLVRIMCANGKKEEAQKLVDIAFWRMWKQFSVLSGVGMDYYTPIEHREHSLKEFMEEWVIGQFGRSVVALGLDLPWYWDELHKDIESFHHAQQIGLYVYRALQWWRPIAGVSPDEREWLEKKYPGWNESYGKCWDVVTENIRNGDLEKTVPPVPPLVCNMCGLEVAGGVGDHWHPVNYNLELDGRRYHFCSSVCKWIFEEEPERYKGHTSIIDRVLDGTVPPGPDGLFEYMGQSEAERGVDGYDYEWIDGYNVIREAAE